MDVGHPNDNITIPTGRNGVVGWAPESAGRGTLSLLMSCLVTTGLCTWVVIHPRIDGRWKRRVLHKFALWSKTIAQTIVKRASKITGGELYLLQAFYIGMFGIRYRTPFGTRVLWPSQFLWLLDQGLLDWSDHASWGLSASVISDKGNADATAKVFALLQIGWFVTLSYIPPFAMAYAYWWTKPKDIETPTEIELPYLTQSRRAYFDSMAISDVFDREGAKEQESLWNIWTLTLRMESTMSESKSFTWLWRISAIVSMIAMFIFMQFEKVVFRWRDPFMLIKIFSPALYLVTRLIMLVGSFAAFRAAHPKITIRTLCPHFWVHLV
ncbi:hypothetical protein CERZMDRAFT_114796 [Cercospora zeae-maydis SCOH1-5]|uniref:Uncharacterized protein n=1 Tax=Cercospora zeae-maydis SCOH1-5 TaxID=717836 RepID=A0A6A6F4H7_9PEZI|nr:hypothetical protein CERZMDRAFT_114796 [Cercospora zeae-maydis SCOH1-5]